MGCLTGWERRDSWLCAGCTATAVLLPVIQEKKDVIGLNRRPTCIISYPGHADFLPRHADMFVGEWGRGGVLSNRIAFKTPLQSSQDTPHTIQTDVLFSCSQTLGNWPRDGGWPGGTGSDAAGARLPPPGTEAPPRGTADTSAPLSTPRRRGVTARRRTRISNDCANHLTLDTHRRKSNTKMSASFDQSSATIFSNVQISIPSRRLNRLSSICTFFPTNALPNY